MPHITLVPLAGVRIREAEMLELGMRLPGFQRRGAAISELPALGLLTLAGLLPEHWTASYLPALPGDETLLEKVLEQRPTLVAISALTASIDEAYQLAAQLVQRRVSVVLGGLHVTVCPSEARQVGASVVIGSGESVWPQVLMDAEQGNLQPEYRASAQLPADVWPVPRWDLLPAQPARYTLQTARGCPLACEFCGASRLLGRFHEKPVEQIRRELEAICARSPRPLLELADDNTFAGQRSAEALLDLFATSQARWFTEADWRIGERPEIVAGLARAGCVQVLMGIESLVFRYPGMGEKWSELERVLDAVNALQESGVAVNGCFIVGAEGETRQSLERLGDFLLDSPFAELQITLQTPFPGTALYRRLQKQGRLLADRGWAHYTLFDVTYEPDAMSVAELEAGFRELLQNVFSHEATQRRNALRRLVWHRKRRRDA